MKWIVNPMDEFVITCTQQQCNHHKCVQNQCNPPGAYCTLNTCTNEFDDVGGPCEWICSKVCNAYCPDHECFPDPSSYNTCSANAICPAGWESNCPTLDTCPTYFPCPNKTI